MKQTMNIVRYDKTFYHIWNEFLKNSKNYHFFFHRDYLSYHVDRFKDYSLLIYEKDKLVALFVANIKGNILYSHQGLTHGGVIVKDSMKLELMLNIFKELKEFLKSKGIFKVIYKALPHIYHLKPSQEDLYALFVHDAKLLKKEVALVIDLTQSIKYSNGRKWSIKRAKSENFLIERSDDFKSFWKILETILKAKHNSKPTHKLSEIEYLASKFPQNIKLFLVKRDHVVVAGAVVYENPTTINLQYVANSNEGREKGALDLLIDHLIKKVYKDKKYFSFGTSSLDNAKSINLGLVDQKERFGARAVMFDQYEWIVT